MRLAAQGKGQDNAYPQQPYHLHKAPNRNRSRIKDWLDEGGACLPKGENGANWVNDPETVKRVRELYPMSSEMRGKMENDRRQYLGTMAQIQQG